MARPSALTIGDCAQWDVVIVMIDNRRRQLALAQQAPGGYRARDSWQDDAGHWLAPDAPCEFLPNGLPVLERIQPDYSRGQHVAGQEVDPLAGSTELGGLFGGGV